ncbi:hypothetical protein BASA62_006640 [Batrachochytrium salamandrivorans]|nr:hypothetical protein BASA62_006640 [Batrachochytrium salamandrivorans]
MSNIEKIVASLTDRLRSLKIEDQALQQEIWPDRLCEPKVALPDKFDGSCLYFSGFINQLELVFQLQSDRYNTDQKMIATLGTLLTGNALAWYNPYLEKPHLYEYDLSAWPREINPALSMWLCFHQLTADLDWNDSALRAQFYFGLSYEIKDALVHFDTPSTLSLAIQQAIKVDNRLYERRLERTEDFQHSLDQTPRRPPPPSPMVVPPPRSSNDMDIDFARRGPLTSEERQQRMSRGLCLSGKRSRLSLNEELNSAEQYLLPNSLRVTVNPNVDGRVMNLEDGDGLETSNRGDGAHDMMVRFEKVVLAPRGETGSITQMPPTTPLHPHSSAISTLSNISNPIHCQPLDSCLHISSLSSLNKLLLPGTLRIGPSTHVDTFFVDCGADDLFVDSKLATDLHIPLVKLSTPIQLRLADGDSSSVISHRTVPLQLHIGSHVETASFYVTNLCHGIILGYSWLERHNPRVNWVSRLVDFDSPYCMENCCVGSSRIQGLGKPPDTNKCFPTNSGF